MRHFITVSLLFTVAFAIHYSSRKTELRIVGSLGPVAEAALRHREVPVEFDGLTTVVTVEDTEQVTRALVTALKTYRKQLDVHTINILNRETTKSADGTPYRRQVVLIGRDGQVEAVIEDESDFSWVYDPAHPDAAKEGPKSGYVAKPNVNHHQESLDYDRISNDEARVKGLLQRLSPELHIPDSLDFGDEERPVRKIVDFTAAVDKVNTVAHSSLLNISGLHPLMPGEADVKPLIQSNGVSCGPTSVAMCLNSLTGSNLTDQDVDRHYGFQLLKALKQESKPAGYDWRDAGDLGHELIPQIEDALGQGLPVIIAVNGAPFSPSGRGTIITIVKSDHEDVTYVDTRTGEFAQTTWTVLYRADGHPDGQFVFLPRAVCTLTGYPKDGASPDSWSAAH
jgi:flagellar basal-body rod protein FlgC